MDLVLWEPATPTAVSKASAKSIMYSCMDLLQPAATSEDRFLMCKSVLKEGGCGSVRGCEGVWGGVVGEGVFLDEFCHAEDDDDDDDEDGADSYGHAVGGSVGGAEGCGLSYLAISLEVEGGIISMLPEVRVQSAPMVLC